MRTTRRGLVFSIEKVRDELIGGDDELAEWAKARGAEFFPSSRQRHGSEPRGDQHLGRADGDYEPGAVNQFLQVADYYLVAHAHSSRPSMFVTHEVAANSVKKIKIPNACIAHGVKSMSPYEMLRTERARFVLGA